MAIDLNDILKRDTKFRYQLLGRLESDCKFYLGNGNRNPKHLWALNETEHIGCMKALWNSFADTEKPKRLSFEQICEYEKEMVALDTVHTTLQGMLSAGQTFSDVHLVHNAVDNEPATIVELHSGTLTEAGKEAWADVLNAKVCSMFVGIYGLQLELSGVKASRLDDFSRMLAGYCSADNYDKWVTPDPDCGG